jgi:hypothetical protein
MEQKIKSKIVDIIFLYFLIITIGFSSALIVDVDYITIYPGEEGSLSFDVENNGNVDLEDVSVSLILENVPFSSVGSSTKIEDIDEDDDESFSFKIKANSDIKPGDYSIPYEIVYKDNGNKTVESGSFGIRVSAETDMDFSVDLRDNIIDNQGQIDLELINRGLGDIKAVSVTLQGTGIKILSAKKIFVGTINPEDSENLRYDVIFSAIDPKLSAVVEYKDFENNNQIKTINLPIQVYTMEEALELGLIKKGNTIFWVLVICSLVILFILWRIFKRRKKKK